jgi:hypothetical protein
MTRAPWTTRIAPAWRALPSERRLAAIASVGLVLTLFLPWYQETVVARGSSTFTGWAAFSWVEAAVLLVAAGVLTLLFQRAEGRAFHLPGGDGSVIAAAGVWTCLLIVWRIFDKQGSSSHGPYPTTSGIEWGIFIALVVAALLTYSGRRIRAAHQPEPALPGEAPPVRGPEPPPRRERPRPERRVHPSPSTPLGRLFAERPAWSGGPVGPFEPPTRRPRPEPPPPDTGEQLTIPLDDAAE